MRYSLRAICAFEKDEDRPSWIQPSLSTFAYAELSTEAVLEEDGAYEHHSSANVTRAVNRELDGRRTDLHKGWAHSVDYETRDSIGD